MRHERRQTSARRHKSQRCRTCRSSNGKRVCPALSGMLICPECCRAKRAKIPGCDAKCQYYAPLVVSSRVRKKPNFPIHRCLISRSKDTGMLIIVGTRKRPDGNLKAMFLLLDLWKKGIRDCFFDANLSEKQFEKVSQRIAKSYNLNEPLDLQDPDEPEEVIRVPKDTLIVEADNAIHLDKGVNIVDHEEASGGKAIDSAPGARATHEIYIPKTGKWYLWARVFFEYSKDSYWIGMDDAQPKPWDRDGGPGAIKIWSEPDDTSKWGRWLWDTASNDPTGKRSRNTPAFFHIKRTGYYRFWSKGREAGSRLDQILLTRARDFNAQTETEGKTLRLRYSPHLYEPASVQECRKLIRHAVQIATVVDTEIPWEFKYWIRDIWGDITRFPETEGSLYKCPKCAADLPQQAVDLIIQHAQSDDIQFYILCRKCGGEFD
ncbi:MAG: hypothetical protein OXU51_04130 [Candidatus Poribacteria bacterium]|nr:hypothetical protein [Candidatus Poribacteria bacterium]